jgi:histidinol dehydrogenase
MDNIIKTKNVVIEGKDTEVRVIKEATKSPLTDSEFFCPGSNEDVSKIVKDILVNCEKGREQKCLEYCQKFDKWPKNNTTVLLTKEEIEHQIKDVNEKTKHDIQTQLKRITEFAVLQKEHVKEFECTDDVGVTYGQRVIPVDCVGCYVPGGRYSHISSAIMTIATAKVARVKTVIACSPPIGNFLTFNHLKNNIIYPLRLTYHPQT